MFEEALCLLRGNFFFLYAIRIDFQLFHRSDYSDRVDGYCYYTRGNVLSLLIANTSNGKNRKGIYCTIP
jgi:hypothetical protein